ncbi:peptidoglycan recognition protein [Enterococcus faecalis]|nr:MULTISPECIES: N-acetylmuramoyl-L-alanine amidase [Enterococcus]EGO9125983.1 lysin [Enterococcus faecalis]MDQ8650650.1 N-acetylmuramoyl-L-alanine amidase [Enterococcus sp. FR042]QHN68449.1 peptidoglycan recognition protein [Enterococcus faecalis]QUE58969.1 peptidoglycan recognition protein [Enterococcus faecalis]UNT41262.1 N-acetylmuramoyl-L-alanine amidase [Enterococcus faecalis]
MAQVINQSVCGGIAGRRPNATPKGVVIHNDAGSIYATAAQYVNALAVMSPTQLANGFAHYYIDRNTIARVEDTFNAAWHTANPDGNLNYVGYEVCQSMGASDTDFLANEQMTFKQVAEDMNFWGMQPNRDTVRLHKEFVPTACPHRSWELHGKETNAVKDYFISQIKKYMGNPNEGNGNSSNNDQNNIKGGEVSMYCLYERPINSKTGKLEWNGDAWTVMFCNGVNTRRVYHPDEMKVIEDVYKKNNGKAIPFYSQKEWNKNAPWYNRLEAMFPVVK